MRRQERHREEKTDDVRVGTIMFGRGDIPGPVKSEGTRHIGEDTAEDGYNIQADAGGLVDGQDVIDDSSSSKAAWASMRPTVLCTKDLMKFSAQGPGSSSLQLDRGKWLILGSS